MIAADAAGCVYAWEQVTSGGSQGTSVTKVAPGGASSTYATFSATTGYANGPSGSAKFGAGVSGIAMDGRGWLYVADFANCAIRVVYPNLTVGTLYGTGVCQTSGTYVTSGSAPTGLAVDLNNNVFVIDDTFSVIRSVTQAGTMATIAGSPGGAGTSVDGTGTAASFNFARCPQTSRGTQSTQSRYLPNSVEGLPTAKNML